MSDYSPGPWVCEARNHALGDTGDVEGCMHVTDAEGERVIEIWGDDDKAEANATLIAAAPEMLAKLIELQGECAECGGSGVHQVDLDSCGNDICPFDEPCLDCADIRAVIEKATVSSEDNG